MKIDLIPCLVFTVYCMTLPLSAQPEPSKIRLEGNVIFSMFQQQVKSEIGAERGERLVMESEIGAAVSGTYGVLDFLSVGLFVRTWLGTRENAQFAGFDSEGRTIVQNQLGGSYSEIWIGPLIHLHWKQFFLDGGYAVYGRRMDDGRTDLSSTTGDTSSSFSTDPSFAWVISAGGNLPVTDDLSVVLKVDFCIRYYDRRGGELLDDNIVHGTQSLAPSIGVAWTL
jgi:hypothetical protein